MAKKETPKFKSGYCELTGEYSPILEEHHIIPVAYGGKKSPTIKILPELHRKIHASARNANIREEFLATIDDPVLRQKVDKLIQIIIDAERSYEDFDLSDDAIKRVTIALPPEVHKKIKEIAKARKTTMNDVILWCLEKGLTMLV